MRLEPRSWLAAAALMIASCAPPTPGFQDRELALEGERHRYVVYVPPGRPPRHHWPVILFLHGSGERGDDGRRPTEIGLGPALARFPERYPAVVVFPQVPANERWPGAAARVALAALAHTEREFPVDKRREYLVGLSMGGNGAWYLAYRNPRRFAAAVVICGWFVPRAEEPTREPVVPDADGDPDSALATRLAQLPLWIFHGDSDPVIPPDDSRRIAARFAALHAPARYIELPETGHDAWDPAFADSALPGWLFTQQRAH